MSAPTFVSATATVFNGTGNKTTGSISVTAGDLLIGIMYDSDYQSGTPGRSRTQTISDTGTNSWTSKQLIQVNSYTKLQIWTATAAATTSITVTFGHSGGTNLVECGGIAYVFRSATEGASAKTNVAGPAAPTLDLTTTQDNSAVVVANGDWDAVDGASRTWRTVDGTLTEEAYQLVASEYTVYGGYHADSGAIATNAVGLTAPSTQKYSIIAMEVKGPASAVPSVASWDPPDPQPFPERAKVVAY